MTRSRRRPPGRWRRARALGTVVLLGGLVLTTGCAILSPPAPSPTAAKQTVVRLELVQQGGGTLLVAPLTIDGQGPFPFAIDTGASTSVINDLIAAQLKLPADGRSEAGINGVLSPEPAQLVRVDDWSLGSTRLRSTSIGVLTFPIAQPTDTAGDGTALAGLLGADQLSRLGSVTIDFAHSELRFTAPPRADQAG